MRAGILSLFLILILAMGCNDNKGIVKVTSSESNSTTSFIESSLKLSLVTNLAGHRNYVFYLDFSQNKKYMASGSADKTVKIWSYPDFNNIATITYDYDEVWGIPLCFSPDSRYLVLGAYEILKVLSVEDNFKEISSITAHKKGIQSVFVSPDSKYVITAGVDGELDVWTLPKLELSSMIKAHASEVWSVCISPDGNYALSGGEDCTFRVWKFPKLEPVTNIKFHQMPIEFVRFSRYGDMFLAASSDATTSVWKIGEYREPYKVLHGHLGGVLIALFSIDDKYIFTGGDDDVIYSFDVSTGNLIEQIKMHYGDIMTLAVSSDGQYLASGSRDRTIKIWKIGQ